MRQGTSLQTLYAHRKRAYELDARFQEALAGSESMKRSARDRGDRSAEAAVGRDMIHRGDSGKAVEEMDRLIRWGDKGEFVVARCKAPGVARHLPISSR